MAFLIIPLVAALGRKPLVQCERGPVQHRTPSENTGEMPSDQRPTGPNENWP